MMHGNNVTICNTVPQLMPSCLATMDFFIQQQHPVVSSSVLIDKYKSTSDDNKDNLLEAVTNILGIKDMNSVNPHSSLVDVGMDSLMATEIKQVLERNYEVTVSTQDIRALTFTKLQEISASKNVKKQPTTIVNLDSNVSPTNPPNEILLMQWPSNELLPKETLVSLKTKSVKEPALFIVHAIEGLTNAFEHIASELDRMLWGLQCIETAPHDTIPDMAAFYLKAIRKIQQKGPYHLAGYSFGSLIALEMALQLESEGEKVTLTMIDGSPLFVHKQVAIVGKIRIDEDFTSDNCMKALAYFSTQFNRAISFQQVSIIVIASVFLFSLHRCYAERRRNDLYDYNSSFFLFFIFGYDYVIISLCNSVKR